MKVSKEPTHSIIPDRQMEQAVNQAGFQLGNLARAGSDLEYWLPKCGEAPKALALELLEKIIERLVILYNNETNGDDHETTAG